MTASTPLQTVQAQLHEAEEHIHLLIQRNDRFKELTKVMLKVLDCSNRVIDEYEELIESESEDYTELLDAIKALKDSAESHDF